MIRKISSVLMICLALGANAQQAKTKEIKPVEVKYGGKISIKTLKKDMTYLSNRTYIIEKLPKELESLQATVYEGNAKKSITATIPAGTTLFLCLDSGKKDDDKHKELDKFRRRIQKNGWKRVSRISVSDERMKYMSVYSKKYKKEAEEEFLGVGFIGSMLIAESIKIKK